MHQADGEILVYSKATANGSAADSPGYLLIDYSVEFDMMMTNPRVLSVPTSLMKWYNIGLNTTIISPAAGDRFFVNALENLTPDQTVHQPPAGDTDGCIYQVVLDMVHVDNPNGLNLLTKFGVKLDDGGGTIGFPLVSGLTIYGVSGRLPFMDLYPTYNAALSGRPLVWLTASTNVQLGLPCSISLVGSVTAAFSQANIG